MEGWQIIHRGLAGWCADAPGVSSSGGKLEDYVHGAQEGALVYDAENADKVQFYRAVFSDPMLDLTLAPDEYRQFGRELREAGMRMMPGMSGAMATLLVMAQEPAFTGLDAVGINIYERMRRKVAGIRWGCVRGGQVVWE